MAAYYCDSSALVKRYVRETGSVWLISLADPNNGNVIFTVRITGAGVASCFARLRRGGFVSTANAALAAAGFRDDFQHDYAIVEVVEALVDRAMELAERHALRGYDAVQLAACLELQGFRAAMFLPPLTFRSADAQLNAAAASEGLLVDDPNMH